MNLKSVVEYSEGFTKSRAQIRSYLMDMFPMEKVRIVNIVLNVYESGVAKKLWVEKKILKANYDQYIKKLTNDYGMGVESAVEALNLWIDACVGKGKGTKYGNALLKEQIPNAELSGGHETIEKKKIIVESDLIYEDANVKVSYYKWERTRYINTGWAKVFTFMFENKTNKEIGVRLQDVSVGGFVVLDKTLPYCLKPKKKGINGFNLIYEDKVPEEVKDINQIDFAIYYDEPIPDTSVLSGSSKTGYTTEEISICI